MKNVVVMLSTRLVLFQVNAYRLNVIEKIEAMAAVSKEKGHMLNWFKGADPKVAAVIALMSLLLFCNS